MDVRSPFVVAFSSLVAACATAGRSQPLVDAGIGTDAPPLVDAFVAHVDAFIPGTDAYVPPVDAYVAGHDAYVPPNDAYVPPNDAYVAARDAYVPPVDMGTTGGTIACTTAAACVGHVVISEVSTRSAATGLDEFVEIQNVGTSAVDLSAVELTYYSAAGGAVHRATVQPGLIIPPGHFALFASTTFADATPDVTERWSIGFADAGGTVELRVGTTAIDRFGWGTATVVETSTYTPAITSGGASYERKANAASTAASMSVGGADELAGNRFDTDHNAADFVTRPTRQPQTLSSPAE